MSLSVDENLGDGYLADIDVAYDDNAVTVHRVLTPHGEDITAFLTSLKAMDAVLGMAVTAHLKTTKGGC